MYTITINSKERIELIDITSKIEEILEKEKINSGICFIYVPHTTAGIFINENYDPSVKDDIKDRLNFLVPHRERYTHTEGNADAHIKSGLVGNTVFVFIQRGKLVFGSWQGVFFAEFDGPRTRKVYIKIFSEVK